MQKLLTYFTQKEWVLIALVSSGYFLNLFILRGQNVLKNTFNEALDKQTHPI